MEADALTSQLSLGGGAKAVIERAYTGGATGDTLHHAWICQSNLSDCKLAATVDTDDGPAPIWARSSAGLELVIGPDDVVWNFANVSLLPENKQLRIRLVERSG